MEDYSFFIFGTNTAQKNRNTTTVTIMIIIIIFNILFYIYYYNYYLFYFIIIIIIILSSKIEDWHLLGYSPAFLAQVAGKPSLSPSSKFD